MAVPIQLRRDTAANWTSVNPTLAQGEIGVELDTLRFKTGNGTTAWNSLAYAIGFANKGAWSSSTAYAVNDFVSYNGGSYLAILAGTNQNPSTATTYWQLVAQAGEVTLNTSQTLTNKTLTAPVVNSPVITDGVFAITDGASVDLNPANGAIQTWTLGANRTPTASSFGSGQWIELVITAGANSITWPSVTWTKQGGSGTAPTLSSSGKTFVILHKVGSTLYGSYLGDA